MNQLERFKVCPSCGHENSANSADCSECGIDILVERVERRNIANTPGAKLAAAPRVEAPSSELPPPPSIRLESLVDPSKSFTIYEGETVGRSDQADVVIEGIPDVDSVSRKMAVFGRRGTSWYVSHIAQTNYIVVDGEEYEADDEVTIREGTILGLALCQFFVRIPEAG